MIPALKFPAVKLEGDRLMFPERDKALIRRWVGNLPAPYFAVTLSRPFRPRSTGKGSQSHRINGFIAQIAEFSDDSFDRLKVELKQKAIARGWQFDTVSYRTAAGVLVEMTIAKSEADASVEEASVLIQVIEQYAAEIGCVLVEGK